MKKNEKKIFIIGTITHAVPEAFKQIEENLKNDFECISTYDKNILGEEKIKWVFDKIDSVSMIVALFPQISFGTSFELGYSIAKNKKVLLITSNYILETLRGHPVICSENLITISFDNYEKIKELIQNLL